MNALPFSPLTRDELYRRQDLALEEAGLAMVCAHRHPEGRDWHVDRGAEHVAAYEEFFAASTARRGALR
ncbi:hypothetical protein [Nocardioides sp. J54]|uniref:hypothetical protein n=1 Tax=Nocardioides sp. J54 TaxID=935866 RepID=UPI000491A880|nr:hypothetical protein [Nocardioides sp. J54]